MSTGFAEAGSGKRVLAAVAPTPAITTRSKSRRRIFLLGLCCMRALPDQVSCNAEGDSPREWQRRPRRGSAAHLVSPVPTRTKFPPLTDRGQPDGPLRDKRAPQQSHVIFQKYQRWTRGLPVSVPVGNF